MSSSGQQAGGRQKAGAYDVRTVIAALIGFYGVVLTVMGVVAVSEEDLARTGDVNANLWAGIGMLAFALAFAAWTRLRPVVVDGGPGDGDRPSGG